MYKKGPFSGVEPCRIFTPYTLYVRFIYALSMLYPGSILSLRMRVFSTRLNVFLSLFACPKSNQKGPRKPIYSLVFGLRLDLDFVLL